MDGSIKGTGTDGTLATRVPAGGACCYPDGPGPFAVTIRRRESRFPSRLARELMGGHDLRASQHEQSQSGSAKVVLKSSENRLPYKSAARPIFRAAVVYHVTRRMT
jgi:hypothetical protein